LSSGADIAPCGAQICSVTLSASSARQTKPWRSFEAVQARVLDHPGVMRTYKHTTVLVNNVRLSACWLVCGTLEGQSILRFRLHR